MKVWDFLGEFSYALLAQLRSDDKRWGDTWLERQPTGQTERTEASINEYFREYYEEGKPVNWLKVAGQAMICWIREAHPEIWNKDDLHIFSDGCQMVIAKDEEDAMAIWAELGYTITDFLEKFPDSQQIEVIASDLTRAIPDGALYLGRIDNQSQQWRASAIAWISSNGRGYLGLE